MIIRSFIIPATNKSKVEEQIKKLNKRAYKLSLQDITLSWGKAFTEQRIINSLKQDVLVIPVELNGPLTVSYDGWQFIATLQHLPTGENIIHAISDEFNIPTKYRNCGSDCEHCRVKRYRKDTYLVEKNNSVTQVGSTCIKDFLGNTSPDDILKQANLAAEIIHFMNGSSQSSLEDYDAGLFHIIDVLACTVSCIRDHGWISKTKAFETNAKPTAAWVLDNLNPNQGAGFKPSLITPDDIQTAKDAADWAENLSDEECELSDYLHNIRALTRSGMVWLRTMGYAASIVPAFNRSLLKRKVNGASMHVGIIKCRENFDLLLKRYFCGSSVYGVYHKYIFHDQYGNVLVWTSSKDSCLTEGEHYIVRGTIKAHKEFNNVKQTEINHCEIISYDEQ